MDRKCKICGGTDKLVDVYKVADIQSQGKYQKAIIPEPDVYCNDCLMIHVWNVSEKLQ